MKFHTAALKFLVASEALRFGVRAKSVVVDRQSDSNRVDSVTRGDGSPSKTGTMYHTVADAGVSDVLLETPADSGDRFSPSDINSLRVVVDSVTRGDGSSSSKTGTMHHTVADAAVSDVLLETPADSGSRFSPSDINNLRVGVHAINDDDEISPFTSSDGDTVSTQRKLSKSSKKVKHPEAFDGGTVENLGLDLKCDPSQQKNLDMANGCQDNDCAHPVWADGCEGCMCFNYDNPTWCDGYRGDYYDTYFKEHGDNPFGDTNWRNRKCNPIFRPQRKYCSAHWQCEKGLYCEPSTSPGGGEKGLCDICNDLFSTVNCDEL